MKKTRYVCCTENIGLSKYLTLGDSYKILEECGSSFKVVDDKRNAEWYHTDSFGEPYELSESITFTSQEDFEDAVMEVVLKRLGVQTLTFDKWGRKFTEQYSKSAVYDTLEKL